MSIPDTKDNTFVCQYCMGEGDILKDRHFIVCGHCKGSRRCSTACTFCIHILAIRRIFIDGVPKYEHRLVDDTCAGCNQLTANMDKENKT